MSSERAGVFLALDGVDGCGKSTQCRLLATWLREQGRVVTECVEPGGTAVGQEIRRLLLDQRQAMTVECELFLFMASRAQLVGEIILPALARNEVVLCDRFLLSTIVYQGHAGGLDPELIRRTGQIAIHQCLPELTIILDLPVEMARRRRTGVSDRFEDRVREFHERVRAGFLREAERDPEHIQVVDASLPLAEVQERLRGLVGRVCFPH